MFAEALPETVLNLIDRIASRPAVMGFYRSCSPTFCRHQRGGHDVGSSHQAAFS